MKPDKPNTVRSSAAFVSEPSKESRLAQEARRLTPHLEPDNPRSSAPQPLFTLGRRSKGKALEI